MSAFLGPIHYWLYNKIQIQQSIVNKINTAGGETIPDLDEYLNTKYGESVLRPLEEVIDQGNIHGWLQEQVSREEYKLAESITLLLNEKPEIINEIKEIFQLTGKDIFSTITIENASNAYKAIGDSLLDGMPCDHACSVIEENQDRIVWKRNTCVHKKYWNEVNGDITIYYILRDEFIKGSLKNTEYLYKKTGKDNYEIRRKL
jgi:hypothetical protein